MAASSHDDESASVRHLVELGYADPELAAVSQAALRSRREADLHRALQLFEHGRGQEAADLLARLAEDDPDWISPHQLLAEVYHRAGRWPETRVELDWLAHHGVVTPKLALMAGAVALAGRDLPAALEELEYASHVEPALPGVQSLLGTALLRLGRGGEAAAAFEQAIRQNPADTGALDGLAAVELRRANCHEAARWALEALEHDMRLFRAHYHLGIALARLERTEAAAEAFAACARLEPLRAAPFYWLSRLANEQQGDADLAAEYREKSRQIIRRRRRGARS